MIKELVSKVIPTCKNKPGGENPIDKCLESIALSTYKNIEIVCVEEGMERSEQRNIGIKTAKGEYILYLDDDQYVSPRLISECVGLMRQCSAIYIPEIIIARGWFSKLRNWERQFYTGTAVDCVRFFKAENCPLFDTALRGPEDADFDNRIKGRKLISRHPLYHDDNVSLVKYLQKKAYYAQSMEYYKEKWPNDPVLNIWYRCFWIFVEDRKWQRLLRRPHFAIAMFVVIFLRGIIYTCRKQ